MANLSGQNIGTNYKGILNLNTLNGNLTTTLQAVTDGDGNASPLRLSTTAANIATPFTVGTMSGSAWNVVFDMTSGTNPGGYLHWKIANDATNYFSMYQQGGKMQFFNPGGGYGQGIVFSTNGINRLEISSGGLLQLGGTTSGFPAIRKGTGAAIEFRLADDSGYCSIEAGGDSKFRDILRVLDSAGNNAMIMYGDARTLWVNGSVGVGVLGNNASARLQVDSTTQGFLPPRMTTTQINAIATPAEGLVVYNTTISHFCVYQGGAWVRMSHSPM